MVKPNSPDLETALGTFLEKYVERDGTDAVIDALDFYVVQLENRREQEQRDLRSARALFRGRKIVPGQS